MSKTTDREERGRITEATFAPAVAAAKRNRARTAGVVTGTCLVFVAASATIWWASTNMVAFRCLVLAIMLHASTTVCRIWARMESDRRRREGPGCSTWCWPYNWKEPSE